MLNLFATIHVFTTSLTDRLARVREDGERGSVTLEQVVITVALLAAAVALVAIIGGAISNRATDIN